MEKKTKIIPVSLNDQIIYLEVRSLGSEENISGGQIPKLEGIKETLRDVSSLIIDSIKSTGASKISAEFGIEVGLKSGKLTSFIVEGEGKGIMKISLEWENKIQ